MKVNRIINPQKRDYLLSGEYPLVKHFSLGNESLNESPLSQYLEQRQCYIHEKLKKYLGVQGDIDISMVTLQGLEKLQETFEIEKGRKVVLEKLALECLFELQEFQPIKELYESGELQIDCRLEAMSNISENLASAHSDESIFDKYSTSCEFNNIMYTAEFVEFLEKRILANAIIQGNAVNKFYLFELVRNELKEIDERLPNIYGSLMALAEFGYWAFPPTLESKALTANCAIGSCKVYFAERPDVPDVIQARGAFFSALLHELVKGCMEYITSESIPQDKAMAEKVLQQADTLCNETYDIMLGPELCKQIQQSKSLTSCNDILFIYRDFINNTTTPLMKG